MTWSLVQPLKGRLVWFVLVWLKMPLGCPSELPKARVKVHRESKPSSAAVSYTQQQSEPEP